ncbi:MAG: 1-deoxy-D-xylulose-5-phosphate reductoisomerase [Sulfobacillus acidophilus]|uniref:1-deoxy-D-xylulose 5-phosphate reductoisomerase n=1 Tax=Sulfobacillus acidophilus TaxID=53633 RepID=A0A2T2WNF4_9FIRM|nr:MAG: 1-deoxy-D-xylulose-5-phosphate reductoisomerase [Sulfobacillus acidophilus]
MRVVILGATGSIGDSAFNVWEQHRQDMQIEGLVAQQQAEKLWQRAQVMQARWIGLADERAAVQLKRAHQGEAGPRIVQGTAGIMEMLKEADATHVLAAMSGFAGLEPTLLALSRGITVLLANKETLVAAGDIVTRTARQHNAALIPVDSEHSAIFQCLARPQPFHRIILTCSGGPFRNYTAAQLQEVTVESALRHPKWSMGPKITIDSATLMNKGLEIIEAHHLFGADYDAIDVVIHPESIIHSMVEFVDGATLAQCGVPDMRIPIAVALSWPHRWPLEVPTVNWPGTTLHFEAPDLQTFPLLGLARQAGRMGGHFPIILNAANEMAVEMFLQRRIGFVDIPGLVEDALSELGDARTVNTADEVIAVDARARRYTQELVAHKGR